MDKSSSLSPRDLSSDYATKLQDARWQKRSAELKTKANWKCQDAGCQREHSPLQAHHIYYEKGRDPWDYPDEAFLVLCDECHADRQKLERTIKRELSIALRGVPIRRLEKVAWRLIEESMKEAGLV